MNFLQIGLGSMGKRRIRCLKSLRYNGITGFDLRKDRRDEATCKYGIKTLENLDGVDYSTIDAIIISTPPDLHNRFIKLALDKGKPAFVEASVVLGGLEDLNSQAKRKKVFIAPSCTMKFHPAIKDIRRIVSSNEYGRLTNFSYHSGQYLPDWHPWEKVGDFYVARKETGGGREIVPFELTWIVDVAGFPKRTIGLFGKTMDVGADIDDSYVISMDFGNSYGSLTVDVVSRYATRSLVMNLERGQIIWKWEEGEVKVYDAVKQRWTHYHMPQGNAAEGYNKNIVEEMYVEEIKAFIEGITDPSKYPNTLEEDIKVLKVLDSVEKGVNKK
jgi:predicted dehydrogenase